MTGGYVLNFKQESAFTLVELLLAIVLTGILLSFLFSFINDGFQRLNAGASRAEIQSDIRLASYVLKEELTNAIEVELLDSVSNESGYNYISYTDNSFKLEKEDGSVQIIGRGNINNLEFEINEINTGNSLYTYYLNYQFQLMKKEQSYNISSKILFSNLSNDGLKSSTDTKKHVIKYKKP